MEKSTNGLEMAHREEIEKTIGRGYGQRLNVEKRRRAWRELLQRRRPDLKGEELERAVEQMVQLELLLRRYLG